MNKKKSYRRYSPEFKREAIKRACEKDVTDTAVCKGLGISTRQFRRWRDELHLMGEDAFPGQGRSHDIRTDLHDEGFMVGRNRVARLMREAAC
jgi:transposase